MKRFIAIFVLFAVLCANPCFAKAHKFSKASQKAYADEIETFLANEIDKSKAEANIWYLKANTIYAQFLKDKNQMKRNSEFITTLELYEEDITSPEFDLYSKLIDITKLYDISIINEVPATDYAGELYNILIPYFQKNNVNYTKLNELSDDIAQKAEKIAQFRNEIYDYSCRYEKNKIDKFYNNVVVPKSKMIKVPQLIPLHEILIRNGKPELGAFYFAKATVLQILSGGFLADTDTSESYFNTVFYVKDPKSHLLLNGDVFKPYLPLKFTGQYYYYRNYYGENRKSPIMVVSFPSCANATLPQIGETFYFEEKPHYDFDERIYCINSITVANPRRTYYNSGNAYFKWK